MMIADLSLFDQILAIVTLPIQILHELVWSSLDFVAFNVLQIGSYLPIHLG